MRLCDFDAARQLGLDRRNCPLLCKLASEYVRKYEDYQEDIYKYFAGEQDPSSLYVKLVEEFERCILSYFAFHWGYADIVISQVFFEFSIIIVHTNLSRAKVQKYSFN